MISVIIPTYNRKEILVKTLAALEKQSLDKKYYEILIVDDGSTDQTESYIQPMFDSMRAKIHYYHQKNRGPAAARNYGIRLANYPLILIIGDDIIAGVDLLEKHLEFHRKYPDENISLLGYTTWSEDLDVTPFMRWLEEGGIQFNYGGIGKRTELTNEIESYFYTCNISMKKNIFEKNGYFDEEFPYAAFEDTELAYRFKKKGLRLFYHPDAVAYHYHPMTLEGYCQRMYRVGQSMDILFKKQPDIIPVMNCIFPKPDWKFKFRYSILKNIYPLAQKLKLQYYQIKYWKYLLLSHLWEGYRKDSWDVTPTFSQIDLFEDIMTISDNRLKVPITREHLGYTKSKFIIVILHWGSLEETIDCIESVLHSDYPNYEILLVDNGYAPAHLDILRKLFPQIELIENKINLGYAEGNNVGIRRALDKGAEYILILNNDTLMKKNTIRHFVNIFSAEPKIGIIGALTWEYTQPEYYQTCGGYFHPYTGKLRWQNTIPVFPDLNKNYIELDYVYGSGMCLRRAMVEQIGGFEPNYYLYFEDIDLCYRAKQHNWKVVMSHNAQIWHKMGAWLDTQYIRPLSVYYYNRNINYFIREYGKWTARFIAHYLNFYRLLKTQIILFLSRFGYHRDNIANITKHYAFRQALLDFYRNRFGEQNGWKLPESNIKNIHSVPDAKSVSVREKINPQKYFIPLPELDVQYINRLLKWLIPLVKNNPKDEFWVWLYPPDIQKWNSDIKSDDLEMIFDDGWLLPEFWDNFWMRWMTHRAGLYLPGENIIQIQFDLKPKDSRFHKISPSIPIRGIRFQVHHNEIKIYDSKLQNREFQSITIDIPPSQNIFLELKADKTYRYGLLNSQPISIAFRKIKYTYLDDKNQPNTITIPLDNSSYRKPILSSLRQYPNIHFFTPEIIRNPEKLLGEINLAICWSPDNKSTRLGMILLANRYKIPILANRAAIGILPLQNQKDILISDEAQFGEILSQHRYLPNKLPSQLSDNLSHTLSDYFHPANLSNS